MKGGFLKASGLFLHPDGQSIREVFNNKFRAQALGLLIMLFCLFLCPTLNERRERSGGRRNYLLTMVLRWWLRRVLEHVRSYYVLEGKKLISRKINRVTEPD
jgi:hypothetical protein